MKEDLWDYIINKKEIQNMDYIYILHLYSFFRLYPQEQFHKPLNSTMKEVPMTTGRKGKPSSFLSSHQPENPKSTKQPLRLDVV